jgi:hypothetical protein
MIKGMKFPITVGPNGGAEYVQAARAIRQNIILSILPASSRHPWNQNLAPDENIIFDINDHIDVNQISNHIVDVFDEMEKLGRAKLLNGRKGILFEDNDDNSGDLTVVINYQDLEHGSSEILKRNIIGGR